MRALLVWAVVAALGASRGEAAMRVPPMCELWPPDGLLPAKGAIFIGERCQASALRVTASQPGLAWEVDDDGFLRWALDLPNGRAQLRMEAIGPDAFVVELALAAMWDRPSAPATVLEVRHVRSDPDVVCPSYNFLSMKLSRPVAGMVLRWNGHRGVYGADGRGVAIDFGNAPERGDKVHLSIIEFDGTETEVSPAVTWWRWASDDQPPSRIAFVVGLGLLLTVLVRCNLWLRAAAKLPPVAKLPIARLS